ncbi:MAG: hypothetical protein QM770_00115 [Tepidisphaeraceae bacterium]
MLEPGALRDEVHKRLTLNWLIQGAAVHLGATMHHLVQDDLNAIDPALVRLFDRFNVALRLQHYVGEAVLWFGRPSRFWARAARKPDHPFYGHRLLSRYGGELSKGSRRRVMERAKRNASSAGPSSIRSPCSG